MVQRLQNDNESQRLQNFQPKRRVNKEMQWLQPIITIIPQCPPPKTPLQDPPQRH